MIEDPQSDEWSDSEVSTLLLITTKELTISSYYLNYSLVNQTFILTRNKVSKNKSKQRGRGELTLII